MAPVNRISLTSPRGWRRERLAISAVTSTNLSSVRSVAIT
ncbi:Uncharacterised protein [Mycobacteroides abscessus subsp. abscessus]|nr:Uncharacterised protein [Mycobacteroides abscessus subsp. abscessus]